MPRPSKASTEQNQVQNQTRKRAPNKQKLSNMTIDQYITAIEDWRKAGEELKAQGLKFQAAMNNAGFGLKMPMPNFNQQIPQNFQQNQPQVSPQQVAVGQSTSDFEPIVSVFDPTAQQNQLQSNISAQLQRANNLINEQNDVSLTSDEIY